MRARLLSRAYRSSPVVALRGFHVLDSDPEHDELTYDVYAAFLVDA